MLQQLIIENIDNGEGANLYKLLIEGDIKQTQKSAELSWKTNNSFIKMLNGFPAMKKIAKEIKATNNGLYKAITDGNNKFDINTKGDETIDDDKSLDPIQRILKYTSSIEVLIEGLKDAILVIGEWLNGHPAFSVGDKGIVISDSFKQKYGDYIKNELTVFDLTKGVEAFYKMVALDINEDTEAKWIQLYTEGNEEKKQEYGTEWPLEKEAWEKLKGTGDKIFEDAMAAAQENKNKLPDTAKPLVSKFKGYLTKLKKWIGTAAGPLNNKAIKYMVGGDDNNGLSGLKLDEFSEIISNIIEMVNFTNSGKIEKFINKDWSKAMAQEKEQAKDAPKEVQQSNLTETFGQFFKDSDKASQQDKLKQLEGFIDSYQRYIKDPKENWEDDRTIYPEIKITCSKENSSISDFITNFQVKNKQSVLFSEEELKLALESLEKLGLKPEVKEKEVTKGNIPKNNLIKSLSSLKFNKDEIEWIGSKLQEFGMTLTENKRFSLVSLLLEELKEDGSVAYKLWEKAVDEGKEDLADKIDVNSDKLNAFFENPNEVISNEKELPVFKRSELNGSNRNSKEEWKRLSKVLGIDLSNKEIDSISKEYKWSKTQNLPDASNWFEKDQKKMTTINKNTNGKTKQFFKAAKDNKALNNSDNLENSKYILERWQYLAGILKD